jgi:hypothetical protein
VKEEKEENSGRASLKQAVAMKVFGAQGLRWFQGCLQVNCKKMIDRAFFIKFARLLCKIAR